MAGKKPPLPQRQGYFLGSRRRHPGSQDDGWKDKKRDQPEEEPLDPGYTGKHRDDGFKPGR